MKKIIAATLLLAAAAYADGPSLSANPYAPYSTSNPYGIYGSPDSPLSANNPYGQGIPFTFPRPYPRPAEPIVNVWATPAPARTYDFSGLSRLDFESGHPVIREEPKPEDVARRNQSLKDMEAALRPAKPEPQENIFDALDEIRRENGTAGQ